MEETVDLDRKDKVILRELQKDARQKYTEIARETGIPVDVVQYRVKKLEENDVIRSYHAFVNHTKLGYPLYAYVMFSLYSVGMEEEESIISYLKQKDESIYVSSNSGRWDLCLGICAKNYKDLNQTIKQFRRKFTDAVKDFEVIPVVEEHKYDRMADLIETEE